MTGTQGVQTPLALKKTAGTSCCLFLRHFLVMVLLASAFLYVKQNGVIRTAEKQPIIQHSKWNIVIKKLHRNFSIYHLSACVFTTLLSEKLDSKSSITYKIYHNTDSQ